MDFKSLRNIETSFQKTRLLAIVFASFCLVIVGVTLYLSYQFANEQREKIYVLDQGKSLILALSQDAKANRPVEAREHVRRFHDLFFTLAPEAEAIRSNIERALDLGDRSVYSYYTDLSEQKYYNRLITSGTNQTIRIDSMLCDFDSYPYQVLTYAKQTLYRKSRVTQRQLTTSCQLVNSVRSDRNPQGFILENFKVLENYDIDDKTRE